MSANVLRIADGLYAKELIPQQTKHEMHVAAVSDYTKASKLMNAIEGQLEGLEGLEDSRRYLINFCQVLINQHSRSLEELAKSMLHELGECIVCYHTGKLFHIHKPLDIHVSRPLFLLPQALMSPKNIYQMGIVTNCYNI